MHQVHPGRWSIDQLIEHERRRLSRLTAGEACARMRTGARMIDVRTREQIDGDGHVPAALEISLNVLEWRLDPDSAARHPAAPLLEQTVIVLCDEGYCSSLAAGRLQDLGFHAATDVVGGFRAWKRMGLPVTGGRADEGQPARPLVTDDGVRRARSADPAGPLPTRQARARMARRS